MLSCSKQLDRFKLCANKRVLEPQFTKRFGVVQTRTCKVLIYVWSEKRASILSLALISVSGRKCLNIQLSWKFVDVNLLIMSCFLPTYLQVPNKLSCLLIWAVQRCGVKYIHPQLSTCHVDMKLNFGPWFTVFCDCCFQSSFVIKFIQSFAGTDWACPLSNT